MRRRVNSLLLVGFIGVMTVAPGFFTNLYRVMKGDPTIWWTPLSMQLPIDATKNSFELFISGKLLQKHLAEGTLCAVNENGEHYQVVSQDIGIRLNNWDRTRVSLLSGIAVRSFLFGIALTLLAIGLGQVLLHQGKAD